MSKSHPAIPIYVDDARVAVCNQDPSPLVSTVRRVRSPEQLSALATLRVRCAWCEKMAQRGLASAFVYYHLRNEVVDYLNSLDPLDVVLFSHILQMLSLRESQLYFRYNERHQCKEASDLDNIEPRRAKPVLDLNTLLSKITRESFPLVHAHFIDLQPKARLAAGRNCTVYELSLALNEELCLLRKELAHNIFFASDDAA